MASKEAEDIEAWAQAEGVPSLTDPFIGKYLTGRDALVEQEKKQRSGWYPGRIAAGIQHHV
jgi:adenosine deaminase CECR1